MNRFKATKVRLLRRKRTVRKRVFGTAERPRLTVKRSLRNIYVQIIDDDRGVTVCQANTQERELRGRLATGGNKSAATEVGTLLAARALAAGVNQVVFDRNGRSFHGRVKALAEAARAGGLKF